jgi:hypothetical protein
MADAVPEVSISHLPHTHNVTWHIQDRRREPSRRASDEHRADSRRDAEPEDETEVQAGENLCAVEGGRSPADVLVFRFDADRAKSVCATQWAHLRSPNR